MASAAYHCALITEPLALRPASRLLSGLHHGTPESHMLDQAHGQQGTHVHAGILLICTTALLLFTGDMLLFSHFCKRL